MQNETISTMSSLPPISSQASKASYISQLNTPGLFPPLKEEEKIISKMILKPLRTLNLNPKLTQIFQFLVKVFLATCIIASISLVSLSSYTAYSPWIFFSKHNPPATTTGQPPVIAAAKEDFSKLGHDETSTRISHILFGISGSVETWNDRRRYSELWWKPNITRGYVWLDKKPAENMTWPEKSPEYKVSQDTSRLKYTCWYGKRSATRIARIVKESFELGLDNVRWFVMGDDDTIFFTENLVTVLRKYDHNQMHYIGGYSESVEQDVIHSYTMGYGGGGFAISYPLAQELVGVLDSCIDRYASLYGSDEKIGSCMSEIGVPLTRELGFHQVDIRGDPYGLLAAHPLAPIVSLHHLDYLQPIFPGLTQMESLSKLIGAHNIDPDRTLQHSFCYDFSQNWSVSVSWGYTVQLYPSLVNAKELQTAFQTFSSWRTWSEGPFTFNTRKWSQDQCERPIIYFLDMTPEVHGGRTRTTYKRFVADPGKGCVREDYIPALSLQFVNVTAEVASEDGLWRNKDQAPRRQCCEIVNSGISGGVLQVNIRGCNRLEFVSPP